MNVQLAIQIYIGWLKPSFLIQIQMKFHQTPEVLTNIKGLVKD